MSRTRRDWDHRRHVRFYCPVCGEVRGPSKWTPADISHNGKDRVFPHYRPFFLGSDKCPGGPIDPVKDRAP